MAAALALTLAGCGEGAVRISTSSDDAEAKGVLKVIDALQCPQTVGVLNRKGSAQAGGEVCTYAGPRGAEVVLHLVRLEGRAPEAVLADFERRTSADLAHTLARMDAEEARREAETARREAEAAAREVEAARGEIEDARRAAEDAAKDSSRGGDRASVRLPGISVEARGEDASVRLPGLRIETRGDQTSVRIGGVRIGADGDRAAIASDAVRVRADDHSAEIRTHAPGGAVRSTYVLTDDTPSPQGWRMVGFEARGPAGGPIVVATVRAKEKRERDLFDAARELVTQNVGR